MMHVKRRICREYLLSRLKLRFLDILPLSKSYDICSVSELESGVIDNIFNRLVPLG